MNCWGNLLGLIVEHISVSEGEDYLLFETGYQGKNLVLFHLDGDCCSETWFADIVGVENLLGEIVMGVEILDLPPPEDERTRQDVDEAYGVKLKTRKGYVDIVYRNSSNGYYGGEAYLVQPGEAKMRKFNPITEDWTA